MITDTVRGRAHDVLMVALIVLRPLIWGGEGSAWDHLAWLFLVIIALGWLVVDAWRGRVSQWRFATGGVLAGVLLLVLLPAALRSPFPSTGLGLWGTAVIHLGFAAYLLHVVAGRERLAFAALIGALAVECLIALGQWAWVLPRMAAALAGGDPAMMELENSQGDLAERVANGGLFGTFTLANTLAAFLLLAGIPLTGAAWAARGTQRVAASILVAVVVSVAVGTASKGAALALLIAGVLVWTLLVRGRGRWLAMAALGLLALAGLVIPQVQDLGAASAKVRLGYWRGATALIEEAPLLGHGLHGFAAHGARTMPLDAEPTRQVHNEVLEAAVDGGLLAGLALLALLCWWARPRPPAPEERAITDTQATAWVPATWPLVLFMPLFTALGMLTSNLEWWPLGAGESTWWLWPLVLSGVAIGVARFSIRLPSPPAWAWQLALTAFALHCLVDFDLHSPAIWGTVIVVAVLAGGRISALGVCVISRSVVTVLVGGLAIGLVTGIAVDATRSQVNPPATTLTSLLDHADAWPASVAMTSEVLAIMPPGSERLPRSRAATVRHPWNAAFHEALAQDLALTGSWSAAATQMETAVTLAPAYLPRRERLARLLQEARDHEPFKGVDLHQRAQDEWERIAQLSRIVHPRNRLILRPVSALPVQPTP